MRQVPVRIQTQVPVRNQHRALWEAESFTKCEAKHSASWHSSSLEADSGPQCAQSLILTGHWFWYSLHVACGPHQGLTLVLTLAWFSSSLVPDSLPYFGWKFPSNWLLSGKKMLGNICSFLEWIGINRLFFRLLSFSNCLDSKMWEHYISTEALISRVTARIFPFTFWALGTQYYSIKRVAGLLVPMKKCNWIVELLHRLART